MERKLIGKILSGLTYGTIKITFWNQETKIYGTGKAPRARIVIKNRGTLLKVLRKPDLALPEAYVDGGIELSEPISDLLKIVEKNMQLLSGGAIKDQKYHLRKNKKSKQASYIEHHYDLGNEFYKLWLDRTRSYSCAYFQKTTDTLENAQRQKIDHILRKLQLDKSMRLLDIGSGWGYLLVEAAKQYGVRGLGVTLSKEQAKYARQLAKREGVDKLVKFKLMNYQDIAGTEIFDRIVSVGFFEHVGRGNLADYFKTVRRLLKTGGVSVLHSITHQNEVPTQVWLDKYIFPGGYIPSVRETTALLPEYGFFLFDYENLGQHYAMTLGHWWHSFEQHKKDVVKMFDERFYRMWRLYLIASMEAFKSGNTHLSQWTFKKGSNPSWPLTREHLYK